MTGAMKLAETKTCRQSFNRLPNHLTFCPASRSNNADPIFKFFVSSDQCAKEIIPPWAKIMFLFMPMLRTFQQRFVIGFFTVFNNPFQADESSRFIACLIKKQ